MNGRHSFGDFIKEVAEILQIRRQNKKCVPVAYPGILFGGGGSTNSVEDRENGDLGAVAP
jgi:hypothetical protein